MSTIVSIADAVVAALNAGSFARPFDAERKHQPVYSLEELGELRVSVVPRTTEITTLCRGGSVFEHVIDVGVQMKLPAQDEQDAIDGLLDLVEQLADHLRLKRLPDAPETAWAGIAHEPVVASESLEQHRVFTSILSVTYRVRR